MRQRPEVELINGPLLSALLERARSSPRLRTNHNFHTRPDDNPHRFLNVILRGSYIRPHRHRDPPKAESIVVLEGCLALFCFNDSGDVSSRALLGRDPRPADLPEAFGGLTPALGVDYLPGIWHTFAVLSPHAVCFEVKPGPWDPANDKEFAPWAPAEDDPAVATYLRSLLGGSSR